MPTFAQTHASLARLADRVVAGEVVFFVGAGASVDSESNTAAVLVARLLARFNAITAYFLEHPDAVIRERAENVRAGLQRTFGVTPGSMHPQDVATLASSYFNIHDWMCAALDWLLETLASPRP